MKTKIIYAISRSPRRVNTNIDLDPQRMADLSVWKWMCGQRSYEYCEQACPDRKCGYYKEAKRRGIDLDAINERERAKEEKRTRASAEYKRKLREKTKKERAKKPKKPLKFEQPGKVCDN